MTNPKIETDLAQILLEIKSDIKDFKKDVDGKLDKLSEDVSSLKVCQAEIKGDIKTLDEKISGQKEALDTKSDQLEKRISNQEFFTRIIGGGLLVSILGGIVSLFWMANKF